MLRAVLAVALMIAPAAAAAPKGAAMTADARLQRLEDIEQIRILLVDYGRTLDRRDIKAYAGLFARDGEWVGGFGSAKGPAAIQTMIEKAMGGTVNEGPQKNFHVMTSPRIEVDGDHGRAWSRWTFVGEDAAGKPQVLAAGRYDDELVREDGRWRFQRRVVSGDLPGAAPPQPR